MPTVYICHAYLGRFERCMRMMQRKVGSLGLGTFLPLGEEDESKIKSVNDEGLSNSDGLLACTRHGLDGLLTLGQSYEVTTSIITGKPTVLWCDPGSYLLNHYLPKSIDCLHVTSNLNTALELLKSELMKKL